MFDAPVETWYLWVGVAVASTAALGLAVALPRAPPPDATEIAATVDSVAASEHPTIATQPVTADEIRIGPVRVWLRDGGATGHASFAYGPVTPVQRGTTLRAVLAGTPPDDVFASPAAFRRAVAAAQDREPAWRDADELTVRSVTWRGIDVTLVG